MRSAVLVALVFALAGPPVGDRHEHPEHFSSQPGLTFDEAIEGASARPGLEASRDRARIHARGAKDLPRVSTGPQLTVQPGVRVAPASDRGFAIQGQLTQSWNLGDLGRRQREAVEAGAQVSGADARRQELETRLEVAHRWIALHGVEASLALARSELELAHALRESMQIAVEAGEATTSDLVEVDVHLASVDARVVELEGMAHDLGLALALSAGAPPRTPLTTFGPAPEPNLGDLAEARARLERIDSMPTVELAKLQQLQAQAQRAQAKASTAPVLTTGVAAQREGPNDAVVYGVLGIGFGSSPGRRAATLAADVQARSLEGEVDEARRAAKADLTQALHEVEHTQLLVRRLEEGRLPAQQELVEVRAARRELGEGTVAEEMWARHALLAAQQDLAAARTKRTWAKVRAWILLAQLYDEGQTP